MKKFRTGPEATPRTSNESMASSDSDPIGSGSGRTQQKFTLNLSRRGRPRRTKSADHAGEDPLSNLSGHSSHHGGNYTTLKMCKLCTKKPLRVTARDIHGAAEAHNLGDNGLIELIHSIRNQKIYAHCGGEESVELEQADDIVSRALEKTKAMQTEREANFTASDMSIYRANLEAMGKFEWDELKIGALLGVGGFSNVSELAGFRLADGGQRSSVGSADGLPKATGLHMPDTSANEYGGAYTKKELVARKFLEKHAIRATPALTSPTSVTTSSTSSLPKGSSHSMTSSTRTLDSKGETVSYRYALKHLRPGLKDVYDKRTFNCAAVDLVWEAQFLLSVQHPNIIKLRGFAVAGPSGYRSGKHNGYFLILDQLPETMEQRLIAWRKRVKKYKAVKNSLVSKMILKKNRETASSKLDELLGERYAVAYEICGAMEYLHERRMVQRDLKISNLGFDVRGDVKLFDFGLSRWLPTSLLRDSIKTREAVLEESFHMSSVGTRMYMAPEVILRQPYSTRVDVYSFGILLWEILALADPTTWCLCDDSKEAVEKAAPKMPDQMPLCPCWPEPLQDTMKSCLSAQPNKRPSFTAIRKVFREELQVAVASIRSTGLPLPDVSDLKYASDDDLPSSRVLGVGTDTDDEEEGRDQLMDLSNKVEDCVGSPQERRRSTHVLNFQDLSWLSSNNSFNTSLTGSDKAGAAGERMAIVEESQVQRSSG
ncbi:Probable LIM domain-containing serine/threonine-protein kinase DDB [Seminavis robusta]|uniref:Probable LIM domain-containing serine/threonine-protein kinase DDB n=1 Tax=Seminavis robusta TaxID=568900 RepID=A0A9N8HIA2_9STRA|nr:Probable LIM domain-containing serine/threonine-protein kinase DDB [Seminavis robusta]|eukprot:Sro768_g199650.1 Probable LIM domain-containing serine/threonine-protein kinase DDB (713) ;mRNA; f:29487-31720